MPPTQDVQMKPEELSAAVTCYLQIRQAVIDDRPESEAEARSLAARAPADIVARRQMTSRQCWMPYGLCRSILEKRPG